MSNEKHELECNIIYLRMKNAARIIIGTISTSLFITLILLITIRFELLNKSFLFGSFEKHNVYVQLPALLANSIPNDPNLSGEEGKGLVEFAKNISPQVLKPLIEDNLTQVIDFLNGRSKDIVLSFSLQGIGFENASGLRWSLSQIPDKNLQEKIKMLNGIGNTLITAGFVILIILVILFFLYGRLTVPKQLFGGRSILLSTGIYVLAISTIGKLSIMAIGKELINGREPSQKILGLLSASLFSDITTTWLIMGGVLILLWLALHIRSKIGKIRA